MIGHTTVQPRPRSLSPKARGALLLLALGVSFVAAGCAVSSRALPTLPEVQVLLLNARALPDAFESSPYPPVPLSTVGGVPPLSSCSIVASSPALPPGHNLEAIVNPANRTECLLQTAPGTVLQIPLTDPVTFRITVRAADSGAPLTALQDYNLRVLPGFAINPFTLQNGTEGRAFFQAITTTLDDGKGVAPLQPDPNGCTATGLPAGLTIERNPANINGCRITGTPAMGSAGTYSIVVTARDSASPNNVRSFGPVSLVINPPLVMNAFALANGTQGRAFGNAMGGPFVVTTTGGQAPVSCSDGGTLPAGLTVAPSMDGRNCEISGTPTVSGNFNVTISATDTATATTGTATVMQSAMLTVNAPLTITSLTLANGKVGSPYSGQLTNTGGQTPFTWSNPGGNISAGACAGLAVDAAGMVTGTPTTSGTCTFTGRVDDTATSTTAAGFDQQTITIEINDGITITTLSFENGTVGRAFNAQLLSSGGQAPFTWSNPGGDISAGACAGLAVDAAGAITGTPTTAGTCTFTARVDDTATATTPATFDQQTITIEINAVLQITSLTLGSGTVGVGFSQNLTRVGGQPNPTPPPLFTWSNPGGNGTSLNTGNAACLGLVLNAPGPNISGTPVNPGTCTFTARVEDFPTATTAAGFHEVTVTVEINAPLMVTIGPVLFQGVANRGYNLQLTNAGGEPPFTWSTVGGDFTMNVGNAGTPCEGLTLDAATGVLSGTPVNTGTCNFTVRVTSTATDSTPATSADQMMSIEVNAPMAVTLTQTGNGTPNVALFDGVQGRSYGEIGATPTWTVTGGLGGYTWCVSTGPATIPAGMVGISTDCADGARTPADSVTLSTGMGGTITGAPDLYNFTVRVFDAGNAAVAQVFVNNSSRINVRPEIDFSINAGTRTGNDVVMPDAVEGRTYGAPARTNYIFTASGGFGPPYGINATNLAGTFPSPWNCSPNPGSTGINCHSSDLPIGPGASVGSPFSFDLEISDTGNAAVPGFTFISGQVINTRPPLALMANMAPPDAVQGRSYGQGAMFTPLIYTVSGGLSAGGVTFTAPTGLADPGLGFPAGFACVPNAVTLTCSAPSVTGNPGTYGAFNVVVDDTENATTPGSAATGTSAIVPVTLEVRAPLTIPAVALANGTQGRLFGPVSFPFTGGLTGFACAGVSLPAGMTVPAAPVGNNCTLNDTPTVNGAFTPAVTVTDVANSSTPAATASTGAMPLTINAPLMITTPAGALGQGVIGRAFSQTFTNSGGQTPFSWDIIAGPFTANVGDAATPCEGLSLNTMTGVLSGTPVNTGTCGPFTVQVTDTATATTGSGSATEMFSAVINDALVVPAFTFAGGSEGAAYTQTIPTTGGIEPLTMCTATNLPTGLTAGVDPMNTRNCLVSGTPGTGTAGTYSVVVTATDSASSTTASAMASSAPTNLTIAGALTIVTTTVGNGTQNRAFLQLIDVGGGTMPLRNVAKGNPNEPCRVTVGSLTAVGLDVDRADRVTHPITMLPAGNDTQCAIFGTPNTATVVTFTLQVRDSGSGNGATATRSYTFTLNAPLTITTTSINNATINEMFSQTLTATGGEPPRTWSTTGGQFTANVGNAGTPCEGLSLSSAGVLSGTPVNLGTCNITVQVTDTATTSTLAGTASASFMFNIVAAPLNLAPFTLENGTEGRAYGDGAGGPFQIAFTGGTAPYTCSSTTLPPGVSVAAVGSNCEISGTPDAGSAGSYTVSVTVTDADMAMDTEASAPITIAPPLAFVDGPGLPDGVAGRAYNLSLMAAGGQPPYAFSQVAGLTLADDPNCDGLTFSALGVLSGTPTTPGTCTFTARVDDTATANSPAGFTTQAFTIEVQPALTITTAALPNARRTSEYLPVALGGAPGATIVATGGTGSPFTWTVTGGDFTLNLGVWEGDPASPCEGLSFPQAGSPTNTVISGTPVNPGLCAFDIQVSDMGSGATAGGTSLNVSLSVLVLNTFAYVASGGTTNTVEVINTDSNTFVTSIAVGVATDGVAVSADGRFVVVTAPAADSVVIIDASTNAQVAGSPFSLATDCDEPRGVATNNRVGIGPRAYIACAGSGNVVAIDLNPANLGTTFGTIVDDKMTGAPTSQPRFIAFTPNGAYAYVTNNSADEFSVIDIVADTVLGPFDFTGFGCTGPAGVVIAPDGLRGYVVCTADRKVVVIDTDPSSMDFNTDIGQAMSLGTTSAALPHHITINPAGTRLYVTMGNGAGGGLPELSIIDTATLAVANGNGVPLSAGGFSGISSPFGLTIPPGSTVEIFVAMNSATTDDVTMAALSPGVAIFLDGAALPLTQGANNPIVFANMAAARGIAHIPIPGF